MAPRPHSARTLSAGRGGYEVDQLVPVVYRELRRLAKRLLMGQPQGQSLRTNSLVNEAYFKLAGLRRLGPIDRTGFFALAARAMRNLLVDQARRHKSQKRAGSGQKVALDESDLTFEPNLEILAIHEALKRLGALDARKSQIVELRYFAGLTVEEVAEAMTLSPITIKREWASAKAWLHRELNRQEKEDAG